MTLRQPFTPARLGLANLWHRPQVAVTGNLPQSAKPAPRLPAAPGTWQFEQMLDREEFPQAESGSLLWLVDGKQFFPELDRQIATARRSIDIQIFIFGNDDIAVTVRDAALRGVDVRVILPDAGDSAFMDAGNLATAELLIRAGAKVYRYPGTTHMKVMICDDWASVGSANFDTLSMWINRGLNIAFHHPKEVARLEQKVFLPDFKRSRRITLEEARKAADPMAEATADQL